MFVPGWMWQTMHWLDGIERVNSWRMGWPDSFARNRGIGRSAEAAIAEWRVLRGMRRRAIVRINDVAGRAAAGAIIAGLIVGARQGKQRIEQARFLQAEKNRIGAQLRAESARAEFVVGLAGIVGAHGLADFAFRAAAAFEHAQHVAGLRNFPAFERRDFRQHAFRSRFFGGRRRNRSNGLRRAVARVAFAESRVLVGIAAVVVERRAPEHAAGASSCWWKRCALPRRGSRRCRRFPARRADRRD